MPAQVSMRQLLIQISSNTVAQQKELGLMILVSDEQYVIPNKNDII